MSLKSLICIATAAALGAGCTCGEPPPGATSAGVQTKEPKRDPASETAPVPGLPSPMARVGDPEEVMLFPGGSPRQIRRFEYPTFGASEFDVVIDLAEGEGEEVQRHAQLALGVRARIEKPLGRDSVRWSLEIIDATANDSEGVAADVVAQARELAPNLIGARAVIDNDKRGRWDATDVTQGTPSGRRAMQLLLETIETLRGLGYTAALGASAEWGHRETRRWNDIELRQTVQYTVTRLEDREMEYTLAIKRKATDVPAPGGGTVRRLVGQGTGRATVRFDRVMPTGFVAVATTIALSPDAPSAPAPSTADDSASGSNDNEKRRKDANESDSAANQSDESANQSDESANEGASGDEKNAAQIAAKPDDAPPSVSADGGAANESDAGAVVRKSKMMIVISARETTPQRGG